MTPNTFARALSRRQLLATGGTAAAGHDAHHERR